MNDRERFTEQSFWRGEGLHVHPNFLLTQLPSGWEMQRQRCWMVLLLCRHPLVHNSNGLMPNLMGSKWRKERKNIKLKKKREQIKPRGYITLSKWNKSLIEHRQGSLRNLSFFLYKWNINKLTRSEVSQTFSPFCRFFALFFSPDWVLVATDYQVTGLALRIAANYLVSACCSTV